MPKEEKTINEEVNKEEKPGEEISEKKSGEDETKEEAKIIEEKNVEEKPNEEPKEEKNYD